VDLGAAPGLLGGLLVVVAVCTGDGWWTPSPADGAATAAGAATNTKTPAAYLRCRDLGFRLGVVRRGYAHERPDDRTAKGKFGRSSYTTPSDVTHNVVTPPVHAQGAPAASAMGENVSDSVAVSAPGPFRSH
jgi:hypothetical protein